MKTATARGHSLLAMVRAGLMARLGAFRCENRFMPARKLKSTFDWSVGIGPLPPACIAPMVTRANLLRSHNELRSALMIAEDEIRKLTLGRKDTPVLRHLRRVLRESLPVAAAARAIRG